MFILAAFKLWFAFFHECLASFNIIFGRETGGNHFIAFRQIAFCGVGLHDLCSNEFHGLNGQRGIARDRAR